MKILLTGAAGFIGSTLALKLLERGDEVVGIDNFNNFYDPKFKENNIERLSSFSNFTLERGDFVNKDFLESIINKFKPEVIAHLGAMANVRHSIKHPQDFIDVNITGTNNLLELASSSNIKNFIFASTGSIYGSRTDVPFQEKELSLIHI